MGLLVAIVLLPVVPAFLPRRWAFLGYGVFLLAFGLLWLSLRGEPFGESDYRGFDALLLGGWALAGLMGFCTVLARRPLLRLLTRRPVAALRPRLALWPFPVGALLAVFFMHWLSNRLAGATPAWFVHAVVAASGLAVGWALWRFRPGDPSLRDLLHVALVGCAGVVLLICSGVWEAHRSVIRAEVAADGAPWCALTFAGRAHPRPARDVLELSRLVSRSGGRGAMDDAHWLIVVGPAGVTAKRWRESFNGQPHFEDRPVEGEPPCIPVLGGSVG